MESIYIKKNQKIHLLFECGCNFVGEQILKTKIPKIHLLFERGCDFVGKQRFVIASQAD
jgi:hypothetical protein